jgi:prepilin signal peptidase PulO-like enzyme (type II secretory pathway)
MLNYIYITYIILYSIILYYIIIRLKMREERRLKVFENRMLRRIFGPKRDRVTGEWRKLHNEELHDLYSPPNIVRVIKSRMRWVGHVVRLGDGKDVYKVLVWKPEGKRPLGRSKRRWEDNMMMDLQKWGVGVWTGSG